MFRYETGRWRKVRKTGLGSRSGPTPELPRGHLKSQPHKFSEKLSSKVNPTTSNAVDGSNFQTRLIVEESRVEGGKPLRDIITHTRRTKSWGTQCRSGLHLSLRVREGDTWALQEYLAHKTPPPPVGTYSSPIPRDLWGSWGGGSLLRARCPCRL